MGRRSVDKRGCVKRIESVLRHRATFLVAAIALQAAFMVFLVVPLIESSLIGYGLSLVLGAGIVVWIMNDASNPAYKLAWVLPILVFPVLGGLFYMIWGRTGMNRRMRATIAAAESRVRSVLAADSRIVDTLATEDECAARQARYLHRAGFPLHVHSCSEYLKSGQEAFFSLVKALESAKHFIFLEFFIIGEGLMWGEILSVLREKVAQGVEVRVLYDDFGCLATLPEGYRNRLVSMGIACEVFHPLVPFPTSRMNHRDHRKIVVIDGCIGFTGGLNLADEYINAVERFGYWKDTAVRLEGPAVSTLTVMFLSIWEYSGGSASDWHRYLCRINELADESENERGALSPAGSVPPRTGCRGFVQPFGDSPLDNEPVGENVYLGMIGGAKKYLYITTPYLVIDSEIASALSLAAKSGVDVRIVTPGIPDKWYVHAVTRSNYAILIRAGVRIFEYSPGFIHAKTFVADDVCAVVGTINLDFRSLYLHFECGVWLYGFERVQPVRDDFMRILSECCEVTTDSLAREPLLRRGVGWLLKVFAPLL